MNKYHTQIYFCTDCFKEIAEVSAVATDYLYGRPLCGDCAMKEEQHYNQIYGGIKSTFNDNLGDS